MAPYSMDLRERVARAWDAGGDADEVAATLRGQPRVGPSADAAAPRNRFDRAASANQVSVAGLGGPGRAAGGADHRAARCDAGGIARGVAHARRR